jgi:hypothetical protein
MDNNSSRNGSSDPFVDSRRWTENDESAKALLEPLASSSARNWNAYARPPQPAKSIEISPEPPKIFGVSHRTIDYSIALREISVFLAGRRILDWMVGPSGMTKST